MVLSGDNGGDLVNNGVISSIGANSITELHNNITVTGGNWTNSGGGVLRIRPGQQAHLNSPTIPAGSKFDVPATTGQTTLQANGAYTLDGTIELNANGAVALMNIESPVTLSGTGRITGVYGGAGAGPRIDAHAHLLTIGAGNTVAFGEFGRTPKINPAGGRDHWPQCWSILMGGGPLKGGTVVGSSDEIGAAPKDRPTTPAEVAATIYKGLGISLEQELPGAQGRPIPVVDRGVEPISELFA